jgi:hypothetical protein
MTVRCSSITPQRLLRRAAQHPLQVLVDDALAKVRDHAGEQLLLAAKIPVDGHLRHARGSGDLVHVGALETVLEERPFCPANNTFTLHVEA